MLHRLLLAATLTLSWALCSAIDLPDGFTDEAILTGLRDPASMAFAPDGRLFFGERITGRLRVAERDAAGEWRVLPTPFASFDVPAERRRSAGLRGFAFDPDFASNGYLYVFYMKDGSFQNRVVRIRADPSNPNVALPGERLLIEVPFSPSGSSGSHNGGDVTFGADGKLYFTTGDGWNGGDDVQSLGTFTGKLFRINPDGSIPSDNPFYDQASGDYRATYALGLRNPYTVAFDDESGDIFINDADGADKATVYRIRADGADAGANFGHDGYDGIGVERDQWANVSDGGSILVTGGAWYPRGGPWPVEYHGSYFAALWGSNSGQAGRITRVTSATDPTVTTFASDVIVPPRNKPVMLEISAEGEVYYMLTDYETGEGEVHVIRYTGAATAAAPTFSPAPGRYDDPVDVAIASATAGATIRYTLDGSAPTESSTRYTGAVRIAADATLRARAYAPGSAASPITSGAYAIGARPNAPPVAFAGPDLVAAVGERVTLNATDSYDPDGDALEIGEAWRQIAGPSVTLRDDDETVANFTPASTGVYRFEVTVTDADGATATDRVDVTVVAAIDDVRDDLLARWSMDGSRADVAEDFSGNGRTGVLAGPTRVSSTPDESAAALSFDGADDRVDLGGLDVQGASLSIALWVRPDDFGVSDARLISKASGQQADEHFWMLSTFSGGRLRFRLRTGSNTTTLLSEDDVLAAGRWTHVAATYDGARMRIYADGIEVGSTEKTGQLAADPAVGAALGNQPAGVAGGSRPFDGLLDEVRIYGRALDAAEVATVRDAVGDLALAEGGGGDPPPPPPPPPGDDAYVRIRNRQTGLYLRPAGADIDDGIEVADGDGDGDEYLWRRVASDGEFFYLRNKATGYYFRPATSTLGSEMLAKPTGWNGTWTQWWLDPADDGTEGAYYLVNRQNGTHIRPTNSSDPAVVQQPNTWRGTWTQWLLESVGARSSGPTATVSAASPLSARVIPNPAGASARLVVDDPDRLRDARLLDGTGRLVRTLSREDLDEPLDLSAQAPGLYLLAFRTTGGQTRSVPFVKR